MISKLPAWSPRTLMWASVVVAIITITLKTLAWWITDSVGLLSDAMESLVNLASAIFGLVMVTVAAQPADEEHPYGHHKAEYFSSGFEKNHKWQLYPVAQFFIEKSHYNLNCRIWAICRLVGTLRYDWVPFIPHFRKTTIPS